MKINCSVFTFAVVGNTHVTSHMGMSSWGQQVATRYCHCWKGTILQREPVQNSIHHHKILQIVEQLILNKFSHNVKDN